MKWNENILQIVPAAPVAFVNEAIADADQTELERAAVAVDVAVEENA